MLCKKGWRFELGRKMENSWDFKQESPSAGSSKSFAFFLNRGNKTPIELFRSPISEIKGEIAGLICDATRDFRGSSGASPTA